MKTFTKLILVVALSIVGRVLAESNTEPPVPVRTVPPDYPSQQRRDGVSGLVTVKCTIDVKGDVVEAEVVKSSDHAFDDPAIAALKKWKFKPAKQDGSPVAIKVNIPIKFNLES